MITLRVSKHSVKSHVYRLGNSIFTKFPNGETEKCQLHRDIIATNSKKASVKKTDAFSYTKAKSQIMTFGEHLYNIFLKGYNEVEGMVKTLRLDLVKISTLRV
jgi:hypothetical protein